MLPDKPLLAHDTKSSPHVTVTFQTDETKESNKRQTRKKAAESFIHHEIQSWSSFFGSSTTEEVHENIKQQSDNQSLQRISVDSQSLSSYEDRSSNRYRSALIGRKKHHYHNHARITCRSLIGTMSEVNQILMDWDFLHWMPYLQTLMIFIDSCFRGMGQVMFANNPLSGLVSLESRDFLYLLMFFQYRSSPLVS
jgi:hypothetical protein